MITLGPKYVCRDCASWLLNQDLHYLRGQEWRYPDLLSVKDRVVSIVEGQLTGAWMDGSGHGHEDMQTDDPCANCSTDRYSVRIPIISIMEPRGIREADQERIQSWYSDALSEAESAP